MTWQTTLCRRVTHELKRQSIEEWLLHLDRLDIRRVEASSDGSSRHRGESTCLSLALWWRGRPVSMSFLVMPDRIHEIPERVASFIKGLASATADGYPMLVPKWHEGVWNDWEGNWESLADRWRPQLEPIRGKRIGAQQLTLHLERRDLLLRDQDGRTRQVMRHTTRVNISCRGGPKGQGTWTMTVPFETPDPRDLAPHIKRAMRHARLRACSTSPISDTGPIQLQPTALAQILATVEAAGEPVNSGIARFLPEGILRTPPAYGDDLGFHIATPSFAAKKGVMRFAHCAALPAPRHDQLWISPGKGPSRASSRGLTIWHFDELLSLEKRFATIASGVVVTNNGPRDVSRLRVDIPWQTVQQALLDPVRRGRSRLGIHFGETAYFVPALSLGEFSWAPL